MEMAPKALTVYWGRHDRPELSVNVQGSAKYKYNSQRTPTKATAMFMKAMKATMDRSSHTQHARMHSRTHSQSRKTDRTTTGTFSSSSESTRRAPDTNTPPFNTPATQQTRTPSKILLSVLRSASRRVDPPRRFDESTNHLTEYSTSLSAGLMSVSHFRLHVGVSPSASSRLSARRSAWR